MEGFGVILLLILCVIFYGTYFTRQRNYWKNRKVAYVEPVPILGNLKSLLTLEKSPGLFLGDLYNEAAGRGRPFLGIFLFNCEPALIVKHPELIKRILVQDFDHFTNRNVDCNASHDPIGARNLFVIRGVQWKFLRSKLSPTFTSGKLKQMFLLIKETVNEMTNIIDEGIASRREGEPLLVEFKELLAKYTTDVINNCAFGIKSNCLGDPNSRFRYFGKKIFNTGAKRSLETRSFFFLHWLARTFRFVFFEKESSKFMENIFSEILADRENNLTNRNDFVDVLIKLKKDVEKMNESRGEAMDLDEMCVVAQAALFYTAGFETTSLTIMFTLYELALHPEIQDRLRQEIMGSLQQNGGSIDYDTLLHMNYLDMVVSETLRKYPPMPFLDRICTKDYRIPDSEVTIKKGTPVFISLYKGLHYDSDYFPDPETYNPDRFAGQYEKEKVPPYSYLPFGAGPHNCIGMRFGLINAKTAICLIVSKYKLEMLKSDSGGMEVSSRSITVSPKGDLRLGLLPIK